MATDIQEFISHLNKYTGPAIASRFNVTINVPDGLNNPLARGRIGRSLASRNLSFQCDSAELPGRTLATFDARTYGPAKKYPYQTTYNDLNLTFICMGNRVPTDSTNSGAANRLLKDTGLWEKRFFDDWMNLINPIDTYNFKYKDQYSTKIRVSQYDVVATNINYEVDFLEVFPVSINQLSLNWAEDSVLRLNVTFAYSRWESVTKNPEQSTTLGQARSVRRDVSPIPGINLSVVSKDRVADRGRFEDALSTNSSLPR
jgi:hypothetical protein